MTVRHMVGVKRMEDGMNIAKVHYICAHKCHNEHLDLVYLIHTNKNSLSLLTKFNGEQTE